MSASRQLRFLAAFTAARRCYHLDSRECSRLIKQCSSLSEAKLLQRRLQSRVAPKAKVYISNLLVGLYGRLGSLQLAKRVFEGIQRRDTFSLNIMLRACLDNAALQEAGRLFFSCAAADGVDVFSCATMVKAFADAGQMQDAQRAYGMIDKPDVVLSSAMMSCYLRNGFVQEARKLFLKMQQRDAFSWTTMIDAFARFGDLEKASKALRLMPQWDVVCFTCLLFGYAENGQVHEAKKLFDAMPEKNVVAGNVLLSAFAMNGHLPSAKSLFKRMPQRDRVSWGTLLHGYVEVGDLKRSRKVFERMPAHDLSSSTMMLSSYGSHGASQEAKSVFDRMQSKDLACWSAMVSAISKPVANAYRVFKRMPVWDMACYNAMVGAYGAAGYASRAQSLLKQMPEKDVVSWTGALTAYAQKADLRAAAAHLQTMLLEGVSPDAVTFTCMLIASSSSCSSSSRNSSSSSSSSRNSSSSSSRSGVLKRGRSVFLSMIAEHGVVPVREHWNCMVGLLANAGRLEHAEELICSMPYNPDAAAWHLLLEASKNFQDERRVERAAGQIAQC